MSEAGCRPLREATIHPLADDAVIKQIPLKQAPEDLFSLGRTIMLLRGLCFSFDLNIQVGSAPDISCLIMLAFPFLTVSTKEQTAVQIGRV